MSELSGMPPWEANEGEDCLVLNVWTGSTTGQRPVVVRLHGGSFVVGSGSSPLYDGTAVAFEEEVVVVTVNHRLGVLGHLHLWGLAGTEYEESGNAGILDLIRALEWVRDNITSFGGDPARVTICGESGGGMKVGTLLAMPTAHGLFHGAILESGPVLKVSTPEMASQVTQQLLAALGLDRRNTRQLWELSAERLVAAQRAVERRLRTNGVGIDWAPVVDGRLLPKHPGDALASGSGADVPLVIGTNKDETTLFRTWGGGTQPISEAKLWAAVTLVFPHHGGEILDRYRSCHPTASALDLLSRIQSDYLMRIPSIRMLERRAAGGFTSPAYLYQLAWESKTPDGFLRACHGLQVPLTMNNAARAPITAGSPDAQVLADQMSGAWASFARSSVPSQAALPPWAPYELSERSTMIFNRQSLVLNDPSGEERGIWDGIL